MQHDDIGILHPGAMGISLAACLRGLGARVHWLAAGRGAHSRQRAEQQGLLEAASIEALCDQCSLLISVCPPHAADQVADRVLGAGFNGIYTDGNAISPQRAKAIGQRLTAAGIRFVDGGIIGPPAWRGGTTCLYLSGPAAAEVAARFDGGPLRAEVIGDDIGKASALKMCYAARTKGMTALLCAVVAAADQLGVRAELEQQWARDRAELPAQILDEVTGVTAKAWRFVGEMNEIAATLEAAGLGGGFHQAAADIYRRLAPFKAADPAPALGDILDALANPPREPGQER